MQLALALLVLLGTLMITVYSMDSQSGDASVDAEDYYKAESEFFEAYGAENIDESGYDESGYDDLIDNEDASR